MENVMKRYNIMQKYDGNTGQSLIKDYTGHTFT